MTDDDTIDVPVPKRLIVQIDDEYERRGYASRSEAIRDALRSWIDPPVTLSDEILEDLAVSREQAKRGETSSAADVRERLGLTDDDWYSQNPDWADDLPDLSEDNNE